MKCRWRTARSPITSSATGTAGPWLWPKGTLCITIAANIAKTGVLEFDACFPDSVVGCVPGDRLRTDFVQGWLGFLQPTLEAAAPQATQKNINLEILRSLPIMVPPVELQVECERRCGAVFGILSQQMLSDEKAEAAFEALLAHTFSG
jgi:type I restriction enzyme S subunit